MWTFNSSLLLISLRTAIIYGFVLVSFRLTGKREAGQLAPFELVLLLLLANAVQNAMTGPDTSVTGGIVAAVTLLAANAAVTRVSRRSRRFQRLAEGIPRVLIRSGHTITANLDAEHLSVDDLLQSLREHGVGAIGDVSLAVLEVDGTISVLKHDELPQVPLPHHRIRVVRRR